jgi:hypothetical protein
MNPSSRRLGQKVRAVFQDLLAPFYRPIFLVAGWLGWRMGGLMVMDSQTVFVLAVAFLAMVVVFAGVKPVPQGREWTVERFGRFTRWKSRART